MAVFWLGSWFVMTGAMDRTRSAIVNAGLSTSADWGFQLRNVLVDGREHTDADTLKAMVGLERGDPIFAFDPSSVKEMIERISWVKTARVERRLPDTIYIKLEERKPLALWQKNKKLVLVDEEGVVLTDSNLAPWKNLMIVVGDGAPSKTSALLAMLEAEPLIADRVETATLVSGRRWDLTLKSGAEIKLPEEDMGLALRKLAMSQEEESLLDKDVLSIDVREEGRITVRTKPGAAQDFNAGAITPAAGSPI